MRNNLKIYLISIICLLLINQLYGQSKQDKIDSLKMILTTTDDLNIHFDAVIQLIPMYGYLGDEVQPYFDLGDKIARETGNDYMYNKMLNIKAIAKVRNGEGKVADSLLIRALNYFTPDNHPYEYLGIRSLQAIRMRKNKQYFEALDLVHTTIDETNEILKTYKGTKRIPISDISNNLSNSNNNLANLYKEVGDLDEALKYAKVSTEMDKHSGNRKNYSISLSNLGDLLNEMGRFDEAYDILQSAYEVKKEVGRSVSIALTELNLADNYFGRGKNNEALAYIDKCIVVFDKVGYDEALAAAAETRGEILLAQSKYRSAIIEFEKALRLLDQTGTYEGKTTLLNGLYEAYNKTGNQGKALKYLKEYQEEYEDQRNTEQDRKMAIAQARWEYDNQLEIINLENEKIKLQDEAKINRLSYLRNSMGIGFLGLGFISFLIYRGSRKKSLFNDQLSEKNKIISTALSEKELLLKEIHHRVKNNLQVVSSLLNLQSEFIKDESAKSALDEGRNRVRSMGLIHKKLYTGDNLTVISVKDYFEELVSGLFESYNVQSDKIKLQMYVENFELDVDTLVPLGLVANELISNALKHAFTESETGNLDINLIKDETSIQLSISDDGKGLDQTLIDEEIDSFGYKMIFAFKDQLEGTLDFNTESGTEVILTVPHS